MKKLPFYPFRYYFILKYSNFFKKNRSPFAIRDRFNIFNLIIFK